MVRTPRCDERTGLRKGTWTPEEDRKLVAYVNRYGCWNWRQLPKYAGLSRCGKSCRLRWLNYLRPNIKRGDYTKEEEETIICLHESLGNRWSAIASHLAGRTDNEIKNHWHTALKKRAKQKLVANEAKPISLSHLSLKEMKSNANSLNPTTPIVIRSFNLSPQAQPSSSDIPPIATIAPSQDLTYDDIFALLDTYQLPTSNDNLLIPENSRSNDSSTLLLQPSSGDFSISMNTDVASTTEIKCDDIFAFLEAHHASGSNQITESSTLSLQPSSSDFSCMTTDTTTGTYNFTCDDVFAFLEAYETTDLSKRNPPNPETPQIPSPTTLYSQEQAFSSDFSSVMITTDTATTPDMACYNVFNFLNGHEAPSDHNSFDQNRMFLDDN